MNRPMSQQLTFSASVCALTMALFALASSPAFNASGSGSGATAAQPITVTAFTQR
ncbi:hypothetical protein [Erythrobacter litoralis]|uniref:Uncharacterized protein n=1 Tax=Erythrobacter litoralis (strain HTCC2594) TaxID=314225 RepID=Q2N8K0_ERYLH|nr:hypothetical protein [Erythrobacter litoralis]ABC63991.1 hypothetical protein ELI_09495 [Erythrobacter litoralis HTCC2594]